MPERLLARFMRGAGYVLTGQAPADWFGPQNPLPPQAPPDVAGRQFDYPFGFNLAIAPRSAEPTGFAELRGLADNYDLLRAVKLPLCLLLYDPRRHPDGRALRLRSEPCAEDRARPRRLACGDSRSGVAALYRRLSRLYGRPLLGEDQGREQMSLAVTARDTAAAPR
jgi:hypothetical protein